MFETEYYSDLKTNFRILERFFIKTEKKDQIYRQILKKENQQFRVLERKQCIFKSDGFKSMDNLLNLCFRFQKAIFAN